MYIRLTSRCNMTCAHCAFSCTRKGQDMSRDALIAALNLARDYGQYITLGGGEPTLHPQFWDFFMLSLTMANTEDSDLALTIVTNGSMTDTALALAKLAKSGVVGASLSQDEYHDRIDPRVIQAFTKDKMKSTMYGWIHTRDADPHDSRAISSPGMIINAGRAKKNGIANRDDCFCDDLLVEPNGKIWMCGCRKRCFGTVFDPTIPEWYRDGDAHCSRKRDKVEALMAA